MNRLVNVYAKVTVESLDGLPDELQHLVSSIRSSDMRITNVLSEVGAGGLGEGDLTRLALQLKQAYKSKRETAMRFVSVLKDQLERLDNCQKAVLEQVSEIPGAIRKDMVEMQEEKDIDSPYCGTSKSTLEPLLREINLKLLKEQEARSKLKRKPTPSDTVISAEIEQVDPTPTTLSLPQGGSGDGRRVCSCGDAPYGDMVLCDNDQCLVGWFHFTCVGLSSKPQREWYCKECLASK